VVVVAIDDDTMADVGVRWPFPRTVQARALDRIAAARPRAIGYDIQISEPTDGAADQAIGRSIFAAGAIVLATTQHDEVNGPNLLFFPEDLDAAGVRAGHAGFPDTPDNVFRVVPPEVDGLASFARATAEVATGRDLAAGFPRPALIDYAGPPGTVRTVSYSDVLAGREAEALRDRIVIVGTTAPRLGDTHPTPFGDAPMSGPEINANAVATIIAGFPLREASAGLDLLLIVAMAAVGAAAALPRRAWLSVAIAAGAALAYLLLAQAAFAAGTVVAVSAPLAALGLGLVLSLAATFGLIERERARLRAEFARFVPPAIVDEVIEQVGDDRRLGGRRMYSTVMFADLRGFTAAAEQLPPEMVIETLNRYLGGMSDVILDEGGTVVSFMGDGIMAIFGAPIEQADHADRAVAAARRMRDECLPAFNDWFAERTPGASFRMGIGLASGPVMSGNVGSERRVEYAAVGDTTNLASRLQGLTKDTPHTILISDAVRAALRNPVPDLVAVGALDVRGRQVPAAVWTLAEGPVSPG
jgi:adenylate cyclase